MQISESTILQENVFFCRHFVSFTNFYDRRFQQKYFLRITFDAHIYYIGGSTYRYLIVRKNHTKNWFRLKKAEKSEKSFQSIRIIETKKIKRGNKFFWKFWKVETSNFGTKMHFLHYFHVLERRFFLLFFHTSFTFFFWVCAQKKKT